ncbi:MAG: hypothetical protein ACI909_003229 [Planctomycetota bacterium]|jgi:hypothetical protein
MSILAEISVGEFLDKLTILQIKRERISDPLKLSNVNEELKRLLLIWEGAKHSKNEINEEIEELRAINEKLWDIEDNIREKEENKTFDDAFVQMARSVYITNDKRAEIKRRINQKLGSQLTEEKSYSNYTEA